MFRTLHSPKHPMLFPTELLLVVVSQKAHEKVWESFKCLDEAWTSRLLKAQWQQLPLEAVEAVLSNKQLTAATENVVYVLVASWVAAQCRSVGRGKGSKY